jgi:hypothetical protein
MASNIVMIDPHYYDGLIAEWYDDWLSQRQDDVAGFLILDVSIPGDAINNGDADVFKVTRDVTRADGTRSVVREKTDMDPAGQIQSSEYKYDFYHGGALIGSFENSFELRWYHVQQMVELLKAAGFPRVTSSVATGTRLSQKVAYAFWGYEVQIHKHEYNLM